MSNFPRCLTRNITSHSMKNLAFRSLLRLKMIILGILIALNLGVKGSENWQYNHLSSESAMKSQAPHTV